MTFVSWDRKARGSRSLDSAYLAPHVSHVDVAPRAEHDSVPAAQRASARALGACAADRAQQLGEHDGALLRGKAEAKNKS